MTTDEVQAILERLAIDCLIGTYRQRLQVVPGMLRVHPASDAELVFYDFDPEGWTVFGVDDGVPRVGASEYVAVNKETGEARYLGWVGE